MTERTKILLAEDDENMSMLLQEYLRAKKMTVDVFGDGKSAYNGFMNDYYDLCIIDVMMPERDGFTVAAEMKQVNSKIPIVFLTSKTMQEDILRGFEMGADDYVTKPFSVQELMFRIEAILRRTSNGSRIHNSQQQVFKIGAFEFDARKQTLQYKTGKQKERLTTKESALLTLLCLNMNDMLERNYALRTIWFDDNYFNARSMDVYITKLRKLLKVDKNVEILNVHGKGYKLLVS